MSNDVDVSQLFSRYRSEISNAIYEQVGSWDDAADLTQETFLRYSKAAQCREIENPHGFLLKTAKSLVSEFLRRSSIRARVIDKTCGSEDAPDVAPTTEQRIIDFCEFRKFGAIVRNLPPRCQEVFILRKIEGLSYAEISERLNITHSAIEKNIMRALKASRKKLDR